MQGVSLEHEVSIFSLACVKEIDKFHEIMHGAVKIRLQIIVYV